MLNRIAIILLGALIAACDSGPSDSDFEAACLAEGQRNAANKAMRREMGVKSEAFCKCVAKQSRSQLSAEGRRAMMLDMLGKKQEASAISAKMSEPDQMAFMQAGMGVLQQCISAR
jgi:hypothetical protein